MTLDEARSRYPGAQTFRPGDAEALNADIIALVRDGRKTMSCEAWSYFEETGEALPVPGRIDIALDWQGNPAYAVRTLAVQRIPFDKVDAEMVQPQGEFADLEDWRRGYRSYLTRTGRFAEGVMMMVETFSMVEDFG
jgi:uncharacterized protein YhfF